LIHQIEEVTGMEKEMFKPFLEWASRNKTRRTYDEILYCVEVGNIAGLWGYLLEFFDSRIEDIDLDELYTTYRQWHWDNINCLPNRPETKKEAIKKAFEILNKQE